MDPETMMEFMHHEFQPTEPPPPRCAKCGRRGTDLGNTEELIEDQWQVVCDTDCKRSE